MFGETIKKIRKERGLTQEEFASSLGVSRQAICMWEANKRNLNAEMITKISLYFNIPFGKVIDIADAVAIDKVNDIFKNQEDSNMIRKVRKKVMTAKARKVTQKKAPKKAPKKVNFSITAPEASAVYVAGDFNSWDAGKNPLKKSKKGQWQTQMTLSPGKYEYKFIIDGNWWTDPSNSVTMQNSFGSENSVKEI